VGDISFHLQFIIVNRDERKAVILITIYDSRLFELFLHGRALLSLIISLQMHLFALVCIQWGARSRSPRFNFL